MSFYTNKKPRLIEPHILSKLIMLNEPIQPKKVDNNNRIGQFIYDFLERNWSFIVIIIILITILCYRYRINKKDNMMKKARKAYMDKLIMDNYIKELQKLESTNNNIYNENDLIIDETIAETTMIPNQTTMIPNQTTMIPNQTTMIPNQTTMIPNQTTMIPNQTTNILGNPYDFTNNRKNIDEDSDNELSFNQLFSSNLDYSLPGFEGNSSFSSF